MAKQAVVGNAQMPVTESGGESAGRASSDTWTFLSNHSHVLVVLAREPGSSLREVAVRVGITERSVQRIVTDLEEAGYLTKHRVGRNNRYSIDLAKHLRHEVERHCDVGKLLGVLAPNES